MVRLEYRFAVTVAIVAYLASFLMGLLFRFLMDYGLLSSISTPPAIGMAQIVSVAIIGIIFAWIYFSFAKEAPSLTDGLLLGALIALVGFAFDALLLVPLVIAGFPISIALSIYAEPVFWGALVALIVSTSTAGALLQRYPYLLGRA